MKKHIQFVVGLYEEQWKEGRLFLHEHPATATSWDLEELKKLEAKTGAHIYVADQCMYGLETWAEDKKVMMPARKTTRFMTNSIEIGLELQKRCDGSHQHQALVGGRAKWAARYPEELCRAICRGLIRENNNDDRNVKCLMRLRSIDAVQKFEKDENEPRDRGFNHEDGHGVCAWDDVTGEALDSREVRRARAKEIVYARQKMVWKKIRRSEARKMGIKVVKTRWIDINKGDRFNPNYRSRFVAKEFNDGKGGEPGWFAATPPLEALKLILSMPRQGAKEEGGRSS